MFFNTPSLTTIEGGIDLAWTKQQIHAHNISNIETPNYKSKQLEFSTMLVEAQSGNKDNIRLTAKVTTDDHLSLLQDGNNVDLEKENIEAYKAYVQYNMLISKASGKFSNYSAVLNCSIK